MQLQAVRLSEFVSRPRERGGWNGWRLEGRRLCYPAYPGGDYPIDATRFTSSAKVLDAIMQVARKTWATDECIAGLVRALDDLLHPQATLCSGGCSREMTVREIEARVRRLRKLGVGRC